MKLIKEMCQSMISKKVKLIQSDYICPVDQVPVRYFRFNGKPESEDEKYVTGEITLVELYDSYPLDRVTVTVQIGAEFTQQTIPLTEKISII